MPGFSWVVPLSLVIEYCPNLVGRGGELYPAPLLDRSFPASSCLCAHLVGGRALAPLGIRLREKRKGQAYTAPYTSHKQNRTQADRQWAGSPLHFATAL